MQHRRMDLFQGGTSSLKCLTHLIGIDGFQEKVDVGCAICLGRLIKVAAHIDNLDIALFMIKLLDDIDARGLAIGHYYVGDQYVNSHFGGEFDKLGWGGCFEYGRLDVGR